MSPQWRNEEGEVERITRKPYPWPAIADFNPDCNRSSSAIYLETVGDRVLGVLQVKGLGVLVFTALPPNFNDPRGKVKFDGALSIFTTGEIGYKEGM